MRGGGHSLAALVRAFRGRRCLVVGDAMLDVFERGRADRLAPDAPAPVVTNVRRTSSPGGAANVAANLAAMGARVTLLSVVGDDDPGLELLEKLSGAGVETGEVVREPDRATVEKKRLVADGVTLARVDSGDTLPLPDDSILAARARALAANSDAVVVSDYAGGTVTQGLADALSSSGHPCVVLDSKSPLRLSWRGLAAATPNHLEAQKALDLPVEADPGRVDAAGIGRSLCRGLGARVVAVTLAEQGVVVAGPAGVVERVGGRAVAEPDVNGAGDTFLAAFALALGGGAGAGEAARLGVEAATLAVLRPGTTPVAADELLGRLSGDPVAEGDVVPARLEEDLARVRDRGGRVVLASGCFDPPNRGHLRLLREARELGDRLVVGLLPDARGRAEGVVLPLEDRVEILTSLHFVDHVVVLDDESPEEAARRLGADLCVVQDEGDGDSNGLDGELVIIPGQRGDASANGSGRSTEEVGADGGSATESPAEARL